MSLDSESTGAAAADGAPGHTQAVQELEDAFAELMTALRRVYAESAVRVAPGLLPASYKLLSTISRTGPITLSALADRLTADKGMISRNISELVALGLVERTTDPRDRRVRLIALTSFGQERLAFARAPHENRLNGVLADWPASTIRQLTMLLRALASGRAPGAMP